MKAYEDITRIRVSEAIKAGLQSQAMRQALDRSKPRRSELTRRALKQALLPLVLVFIAILAAWLPSGCQSANVQAKDLGGEKAAVQKTLDTYIRAVEKEDMDLYAQAVAQDAEMVMFGTGAGERLVGWEALKQAMQAQFDALSDVHIQASDTVIFLAKDANTAWATSLWTIRARYGDQAIELPVRCSWVLEKRPAGWVVVQFHKSVGQTE